MNCELMDYLSLFPAASRERPRFMALAEAVLRQAADLMTLAAALQPGYSFARAEGIQLDCEAEALGLKRADSGTDASDEAFRRYVLAKLALWTWDGTNETVPAVLEAACPGSILTDNGDGTVTVSGGSVLPIPAGIGKTIQNSECRIQNQVAGA